MTDSDYQDRDEPSYVAVTDREPTPETHSVGVGWEDDPPEESTRTRARVHARVTRSPAVPDLLHTLFVGDSPWPLAETLPRLKQRIDYTLHGEWCAPEATKLRWIVLLLFTLPIACPVAVAVDLVDWAAFPLGRLLVSALLVWLVVAL